MLLAKQLLLILVPKRVLMLSAGTGSPHCSGQLLLGEFRYYRLTATLDTSNVLAISVFQGKTRNSLRAISMSIWKVFWAAARSASPPVGLSPQHTAP